MFRGERAIAANAVSVTLVKSKDKGLGFDVEKRKSKPYVAVVKIKKGGPAEKSGLLRIGDVVLAVNQTNLCRVSYEEGVQALKEVQVGGNVVLIVAGADDQQPHLQTVLTSSLSAKTVRFSTSHTDRNDGNTVTVDETRRDSAEANSWDANHQTIRNEHERSANNNLKPDASRRIQRASSEDEMNERSGDDHDRESRNLQGNAKKQSFVILKNWESCTEQRDLLQSKALRGMECSMQHCVGSVMMPQNMTVDPRTWKRNAEEKLKLAMEFIDQYFQSSKRSGTEDHKNRMNEVKQSIKSTGSYNLTESELVYGAKMAWRNAPRCIGRVQWNKLQVYDCRHVTSTAEMFDAICKHLQFATNKGNIRSCVTFFPQRSGVESEFRVWNSQLIRYAGYEQRDGSIVGDPANVELTQICERLGWKGKGERFDVLPILLQANGQDPELYELPEDLILEVKIRHPTYPCVEEMDLKWYAVPAVSNMLIDIGGLHFPACPFNGWFMGTEIGRDLCDVARYNMLEPIATKMGFAVNNMSSLWKDRALLELNFAILHSFQADKVTIMDHHNATESFMKHFHNELKLRGGCPGDWVWLVPPLSGSATPIFHQEILNYMLNPACYYQPDPWKYYTWKNSQAVKRKANKLKFKSVARSIHLTSAMMSKAMQKRTKATIVFATETGKSQSYAETLKQIFNYAFDAKVELMSEYELWKLEYETLLLVVTSTFGNGDPPENGESFARYLENLSSVDDSVQRSIRKSFDSVSNVSAPNMRFKHQGSQGDFGLERNGVLGNVKFSVFGLGSRAYPNFCAFAHAIDTLLGDTGAERLYEIGEGDELSDQEEKFREWAKNVFATACEYFCIGDEVDMKDAQTALSSSVFDKKKLRVNVLQQAEKDLEKGLSETHRKKVTSYTFEERLDLHPRQACRSTILVKLKREESCSLCFQPGDHIGIFPCNRPELVRDLLGRIQDVPEENTVIQLEILEEKRTLLGVSKSWRTDTRLPLCSVWTAFSRYLDISSPPSPKLLKLLANFAVNVEDKERLDVLSQGEKEYEEWKFHKMPNIIEVLDEFPSIRVETSLLLSQLPLLQCRYYSISSSPDVYPNQVHCTVSVVRYYKQGGEGNLHHGVCSTYLDRMVPGEKVNCFIRQAGNFHLPLDRTLPCVMVGPGSGIAPFRGFWQQRSHEIMNLSVEAGDMMLLFGCRHPDEHIYRVEVEEAQQHGVITHSHTAYSRLPGQTKEYVQNVMEKQVANYVYDVLYNKKGHFYVCGDVIMAGDVKKSLKSIVMRKTGLNDDDVEKWICGLWDQDRYHEDIFGVTLRTKEVTDIIRMKTKEAQ